MKYGTESNAILVSKNAADTSATVSIPSIGFQKTFHGTSSSDLGKPDHEITPRKTALTFTATFIRSVNQRTTLGVTDGNPLAATALLSNQTFTQFGLRTAPYQSDAETPNPLDQVATPNIQLDLNGGYSHASAGNGYFVGGGFSAGMKFGERVGLVFTTPLEYRYVNGAAVYDIGEQVSLPVVVMPSGGNGTFSWLVTPTFSAAGAGSVDLASGGVFLGGGITSALSCKLDGFVFTVANHYNYYHGFPITIGDYKFDTNLDQQVLKNGAKITRYFGEDLFLDGGITFTNFLQSAAVHQYWTPTAGLGLRLGPNAGVRVGYAGDFGPGFIDHGGELQLYFNYYIVGGNEVMRIMKEK